jgi:hypothetical protein
MASALYNAMQEPFASLTKFVAGGFMRTLSQLLLFSVLSPHAAAQDAATIIQRSAQANERDWIAAPQFDNSERDRNKDGDKTYDVTMLFGSPYERLIAIDGRPLNPSRQQEEQSKFEETRVQRQHESAQARAQRTAKYEAERKRDHTMIQQLMAAFDFHLVENQTMKGRNVYVLKATPRKGYQPPDRDSKVLTGMEGTLWIDRDTFQWVKVEAHVTHPVSIAGFLAEVEPGTQFELEKEPVAGDIWLASHFSMKSKAKILRFYPRKRQEDDTYFSYRKSPGGDYGMVNPEDSWAAKSRLTTSESEVTILITMTQYALIDR